MLEICRFTRPRNSCTNCFLNAVKLNVSSWASTGIQKRHAVFVLLSPSIASPFLPHSRRYYNRSDTEDCVRYLNGARLDDRLIRVDIDVGFTESRQYGRGRSGGQVLHASLLC